MVGQMSQMQQMSMQGGQLTSINNMNMPITMNAANLNQSMNAGQQINPNQMTQMLNRINSVQNIVQPNAPNVTGQMNQSQMVNCMEYNSRYMNIVRCVLF